MEGFPSAWHRLDPAEPEIGLEFAADGDEGEPAQPSRIERGVQAVRRQRGKGQVDLNRFRACHERGPIALPGMPAGRSAQMEAVGLAVAHDEEAQACKAREIEGAAVRGEVEAHLDEAAVVVEAHPAL